MKLRHILNLAGLLGLGILLTSLGFWQLDRAKTKQGILDANALAESKAVVDCQNFQVRPQAWQKCRVQGQLMPTRVYLDNQFLGHQLGYEVFGLLKVTGQEYLLVDMGWVALGKDRNEWPDIKLPDYQQWEGQVYFPNLAKISLGNLLDRHHGSNYVVEQLDLKGIAKILHQPLLPWVLRMSLQQTTGLTQEWKLVSVHPERHYAYALQWFSMATVIFLILIWRIIR